MTNKEFFQQCSKAEVAPTLTALKALPSADKPGYKPAEKNRTAKQLRYLRVYRLNGGGNDVENGIC